MELLSISDELSRDYTPSIPGRVPEHKSSIRFTPQELLAISEEISREFAVHSAPQTEPSEIVLLPVDPGHLHAYWHLNEQQNEVPATLDKPLTLRVYAMPDGTDVGSHTPAWFDVVIDPPQTQHKVAVPSTMTGNFYAASIGHQQDVNHFTIIASSKTAYIPRNIADLDVSGERIPAFANSAVTASGRGQRI